MDTLTHTFSGIVLSGLSFRSDSEKRAIIIASAITANLPDIDTASLLLGMERYLQYHRLWGHSIFLIPIFGFLGSLLFRSLSKNKTAFLRKWFFFSVIVTFHLFWDILSSYGINIFLPISPHSISLHILPIFDLWICVLFLIAGLLIITIGKKRRVIAILTLVIFTGYIGFRFWAKSESEKIFLSSISRNENLYSFANIATNEDWLNPSSYRVAIYDGDSAKSFRVYPLKRKKIDEGKRDVIDKSDEIYAIISKDKLFSIFIKRALLPIYSINRDSIFVSDLRYSSEIGNKWSIVIFAQFEGDSLTGNAHLYKKMRGIIYEK